MILPQVHLRKPCYDLSFLQIKRFKSISPTNARVLEFHLLIQSVGATGGVYKGQGRIQRALLTRIYKGFLVHDGDYNRQSQLRQVLREQHSLSAQQPFDPNIVARVQPRASKGHHGPVIATLFRLLNRRESQLEPIPSRRSYRYLIGDNLARQLNQRQTGQPTHHQRPCTTKSPILKSLQNVSPKEQLVLVSFPVLIQIKPQAPPLVCPSVNSFKFQPCGRSSPRAQEL